MKELYEKYKDDVYKYLYCLTHDKLLAEDLTSETFLAVLKSLHTFKGNSSVKTWIFGIARNKWLENTRKNKDVLLETDLEITCSPEEYSEIVELIWELIENEKHKEIFQLRYDGYSFLEIAEKKNISENSARVLYFRLKNKIKSKLIEEGYSYE